MPEMPYTLWSMVSCVTQQETALKNPRPVCCFSLAQILPENILVRVLWGGVAPLGGEPTVNTTGAGLLAPPPRAPGCRVPPKPAEGAEEQDHDKGPDSIYFEGLPCKWFAPKGSSGEKPCEEILRVVFESFGKIKNVDIPMLDPYREVMTGGSFGGLNFGLQTFEAFIQYQESTDFIKAMESLRGMKLMLKGDDGKALACNIKVRRIRTSVFTVPLERSI